MATRKELLDQQAAALTFQDAAMSLNDLVDSLTSDSDNAMEHLDRARLSKAALAKRRKISRLISSAISDLMDAEDIARTFGEAEEQRTDRALYRLDATRKPSRSKR